MQTARVWDADSRHVQVTCNRLYYAYSIASATRDNIASLSRNLAAFAQSSDQPIGYILHAAADARPPSADDRADDVDVFDTVASRLVGVALVVDTKGCSGAVLRSALTLAYALKRQGCATRTFESVDGAAQWLGPLVGMPPEEIAAVTRQARDSMPPPPAPPES
jgi:hypothetical protein